MQLAEKLSKGFEIKIIAFFDGCCEPVNPGGTASYGAVVLLNGTRIWEDSQVFVPKKGREKETSNNVAEYSGFKAILEYLLKNDLNQYPIEIFGDSNLVIKQMSRKWKIRDGFYVPIALECRRLIVKFPLIKLTWIPREENTIADELSKKRLHERGVKFKIQPE